MWELIKTVNVCKNDLNVIRTIHKMKIVKTGPIICIDSIVFVPHQMNQLIQQLLDI